MKPVILSSAVVALSIVVLAGCSSSSNPAPATVFDSGNEASPQPEGGKPEASTKTDGGIPDAPPADVTVTTDAPADVLVIDGNLPDVGNCMSDAAACNSCYTPAQDPLNGCSPATVNCIPFDNTRVPTGAP